MPQGFALYLRRYIEREHGTPKALMEKFKANGASWIAIAGPWDDDPEGLRFLNSPATCIKLIEAAKAAGLVPYIWGYPFLGREEAFVNAMARCVGDTKANILLDPELGSNPTRAASGAGKTRANAGATKLINLIHARFPDIVLGLSTFGSGVRMKWFPLLAFLTAMAIHYPGKCFAGGQTYTDDGVVDRSIADFLAAIGDKKIQLVPNFGTYAKTATGYRAKTAKELDAHLFEFVNEGEPVEALIGWAENFMTPDLWKVFAKHATLMKRGAYKL